MRACGGCFFGQFPGGADQGECWLRPPTVLTVPVYPDRAAVMTGDAIVEFHNVRPSVQRDEYCGHFSPRIGPKTPPARPPISEPRG